MRLEAALDMARRERLYPSLILHGADLERRLDAAVRLARAVLCAAGPTERPCGRCQHCRRLAWPPAEGDSFHPDLQVLERDRTTVTSVEATKQFLRGAQVAPFEARGQAFIIASAESLSGEAANALLKTLEEPPDRAPRHFFLLAPSQFDLLPTLRSRSMEIFLGAAERPLRWRSKSSRSSSRSASRPGGSSETHRTSWRPPGSSSRPVTSRIRERRSLGSSRRLRFVERPRTRRAIDAPTSNSPSRSSKRLRSGSAASRRAAFSKASQYVRLAWHRQPVSLSTPRVDALESRGNLRPACFVPLGVAR